MIELGSLAFIAFVVNIIIEMTKEVYPIKKIPTRLYAVIISLVVNFAILIINGTTLSGGAIASNILSSFIIAYIAIFGYDNIYQVLKKYVGGDNNVSE